MALFLPAIDEPVEPSRFDNIGTQLAKCQSILPMPAPSKINMQNMSAFHQQRTGAPRRSHQRHCSYGRISKMRHGSVDYPQQAASSFGRCFSKRDLYLRAAHILDAVGLPLRVFMFVSPTREMATAGVESEVRCLEAKQKTYINVSSSVH